MIRSRIVVAALALGAVLSGTSGIAMITDLSTDTGTVGTQFDVMGLNFSAKPKVFLARNGEKVKGTKLKIRDIRELNQTTAITVEIKKAFPGAFQVAVVPKGGDPFVSKDRISVEGPRIVGISPDMARPGDEVNLTIGHLGNKPPQVFVHTKRAKVSGTFEGVPAKPAYRFTDVIFKVPKVAPGVHNISVRNKIGVHSVKLMLTVTDSEKPIGGSRLDVVVNGAKLKSRKVTGERTKDGICCRGVKGGRKRNRQVKVLVPFNPDKDQAPQRYDWRTASLEYVVMVDGQETTWRSPDGGDLDIVVNALDPETCTILMTVCGTLAAVVPGTAPANVSVTGPFACQMEKPPEEP